MEVEGGDGLAAVRHACARVCSCGFSLVIVLLRWCGVDEATLLDAYVFSRESH